MAQMLAVTSPVQQEHYTPCCVQYWRLPLHCSHPLLPYCRVLRRVPLRRLMLAWPAQALALAHPRLLLVQTSPHTMWWPGPWHEQLVSQRYTHWTQ